ncbi:MAG: Gfo/Idh/MocA family protein [Bacteroidales bacterium]
MPNKARIGIIGYGLMGRRHARVYAESGLCRISAVSDCSANALYDAQARYQCDIYEDYRQLLTRSDIDAVSICLPDSEHFDAVSDAIMAGKHVLVEKPLTTDVQQAAELVRISRDHDTAVMVGHLLRFDPRYSTLRDAIRKGALGSLVFMSALRSSPFTGPMRYRGRASLEFHVAVHDIDIMLWCSGESVSRVNAIGASKVLEDIDTLDVLLATLEFESGLVASLEASWVLPANFPSTLDSKLRVVGTSGVAVVDTCNQGISVASNEGVTLPDTMRWAEVGNHAVGILRNEIMHFIICILEGKRPLVSIDDAYQSVAVADAIRESLRSGKPEKVVSATT